MPLYLFYLKKIYFEKIILLFIHFNMSNKKKKGGGKEYLSLKKTRKPLKSTNPVLFSLLGIIFVVNYQIFI